MIKLAVREAVDVLNRQPVVDQEARNIANAALQAIASHERVCKERADSADIQRTQVQEALRGLATAQREAAEVARNTQNKQLIAIIVILFGMVTFFVVPYFTGHPG